MEQVVYAGGTAGLIAYLLYTVYQFGSGNWRPGKDVVAADVRALKAVEAGERAVVAVEALTKENRAWRGLVERMLVERGLAPPAQDAD